MEIIAVMLYVVVYLVYVFLPLIPARLVYKWFPDTQASASGQVSMVKFKLGGVAAMYIVTVAIGAVLVDRGNFDDLIRRMTEPTWEVFVPLEFKNNKEKIAMKQILTRAVVVNTDPSRDRLTEKGFYLKLPLRKPDDWPTVYLEFPGFEPQLVELKELLNSPENFDRHDRAKQIHLKKTREVQQRPEFRNEYCAGNAEVLPLKVGR